MKAITVADMEAGVDGMTLTERIGARPLMSSHRLHRQTRPRKSS